MIEKSLENKPVFTARQVLSWSQQAAQMVSVINDGRTNAKLISSSVSSKSDLHEEIQAF